MKYYLIAGEASGDLHASHLMKALKQKDAEAQFRYYGGDLMHAEGGELVQHYRDLAYMGFIPVLMHLRTILKGMKRCKQDIVDWQPDVLILIDYPGFNLSIAKYIHANTNIPVHYYISPKIWAWKERRIKNIKRDVDHLYSILPFEVEFFEGKHYYPIDYVGNPTLDEISEFQSKNPVEMDVFLRENELDERPIIALLSGSRQQEIKDNLTRMIAASAPFIEKYQLVVAGAPSIEKEFYAQFIKDLPVKVLYGQTFRLLQHSTAALVTSGTATLETALFRVPQVVCYYMRMGWLVSKIRPFFLKIPFISLVNLVADKEVVPELVADGMNVQNVRKHLEDILPGASGRETMLRGYELMREHLGNVGAPSHAAELIIQRIKRGK
ncbi:MAG: lipid-A-disaccharide synthase [Bacteroidales bacterium]|nr:lipid-A-disaccharide synthase [Bacteroidales bacterium]